MRIDYQKQRVRLLALRGEIRQPAELGVVLHAQGRLAGHAARRLERRREYQLSLLRTGEIGVNDGIERQQPVGIAVAHYGPDFGSTARLLEPAFDERDFPVDASEVTGIAIGRAQRNPLQPQARPGEVLGSLGASDER